MGKRYDFEVYHWVRVASFDNMYRAAALQTLLQSNEVRCKTEQRNTEYYPFHDTLDDFVVLVYMDDVGKAGYLMKEAGYFMEETDPPSAFMQFLDERTKGLFWIGQYRVEIRLFILVGIFSAIVLAFILLFADEIEHWSRYR